MSNFQELTDKFKKFNHHDRIIGILDNNDYYKVATTVYEVLTNISTFLPLVKRHEPKIPEISGSYREAGNSEFSDRSYGATLQLYNLAAMHAPPGSRELMYAYSNRSALNCKIHKYSAALIDIERGLSLKCTPDLQKKLVKRKEECEAMMWQEDVVHNNELGEFNDAKLSEEFFKVSGKRNPKFPIAKSAVNVVMKNGKETVVAQSDIKFGEIIAIETAFAFSTLEENALLLCYNCNRGGYTMIPCKTCAHVLFCNEACRDQCWEEHHNFECPMMEIFRLLPFWCQIWFKYTFKTWNMNKDLQKFAEISDKIDALLKDKEGAEKLEMGNVKTYLHPPAKDRIKTYGRLYDASIHASLTIHGLQAVPEYCFGKAKKAEVIKHIIKQFMYHSMHTPINPLSGATLSMGEEDVLVESFESIGFFPFMSRCKHDCNANTMTVGLGNKLAMIAVAPIKAGTELTTALGGEYADTPYMERRYSLYNIYAILCECQACTEDWKEHEKGPGSTTPAQVVEVQNRFQWIKNKKDKYTAICESMSQLNGPEDKMYRIIYTMFRQLLSVYQYGATKRRFEGKGNLRNSDLENVMYRMHYIFDSTKK